MRQDELRPPTGARRKKKRVGRGTGGHGGYSGRGCKGQKSRSGGNVRLGFEGGQLPLIKRLPRKGGFTNIFKKEYNIVNVGKLDIFPPNSKVTSNELFTAGLIKSVTYPVKILGAGDIHHPLSVTANKFSDAAQKKIMAAGGEVKQI
jgi:large subunit ribosomal protein L15